MVDIGETWNDFTDWVAGEGRQDDPNPQAVEDTFTQQREGVRNQSTGIGFDGEFRPQQVLDTDEFEQWDISTLRQRVDQIDLGVVSGLVDAWTKIAGRADTALSAFTADIAKVADPNVWRGAARDSAVNGVNEYATHGAQLCNSSRLTANKLNELRTGLEPTKQLVPHAPEHRSGLDNTRGWVVGRGWRNDDVAEHNAKVEAVRVLSTVYAPTINAADTGVPVVPRPHNPVDDGTDDPATPPGQSTGDQPGGEQPIGEQPGTPAPVGENPAGENPTSEQPQGSDPPTTQQPTDTETDSAAPAPTTPAATTPAGAPTTTTPPGAPGGPTGNPGTGTGGPGAAPGGPGQSVPGVPGTNTAAPSPAAGPGAPGNAARGTPAAMGGAPAARGNNSDDESTKGAPDYLINQEHGEELTGLDSIPKTVPPVIGE